MRDLDSHILIRPTCDGTLICFIFDPVIRAQTTSSLTVVSAQSRALCLATHARDCLFTRRAGRRLSGQAGRCRSLPGELDDQAIASDGESLALALLDDGLRLVGRAEGHEAGALGLALVI